VFIKEVDVTNGSGLHARPALQFVKKSNLFSSKISIGFKEKEFNAKSIVGIMAAGIIGGSTITIKAEGEDEEMNPFLGYRAIRLCLGRIDIFKVQLRALLRASSYGNLKIMFPMISSL